MVFNATFNNISVISLRSFYWWRKPVDPDKTTDLSQITDKFYHIIINRTKISVYFLLVEISLTLLKAIQNLIININRTILFKY